MKYKILQIFRLILKIINKPSSFQINYGLYKISKIKRYQKFHTTVIGKDMKVADSKSFLAAYREIFEHEIYKFHTHSDNPLIIDCGANIGLSVIYFNKLYPNSKIIAFEPDEKIFKILEYNTSSFSVKNLELIKKGLSNTKDVTIFFSEGADGSRIAIKEDKKNITEIKTTRLIDYLDNQVDFLKIDIEGAEYCVLQDCKNALSKVQNLFIEYHSFVNQEQRLDEILKILKIAGFRYYINQSGTSLRSPFVQKRSDLSMDLQLNIFAYRK